MVIQQGGHFFLVRRRDTKYLPAGDGDGSCKHRLAAAACKDKRLLGLRFDGTAFLVSDRPEKRRAHIDPVRIHPVVDTVSKVAALLERLAAVAGNPDTGPPGTA